MLAAVAYGISLVDKRTWEKEQEPCMAAACVQHVPSLQQVPASLFLTEAFQKKHRHCSQLLKTASARPRSKWRIAEEEKAYVKMHRVSCTDDVAAFIRRARRILRPGGKVQGTLFPASAAMSLISKELVGAPSVASDGEASRSARASSGHAQLARVATRHTRRFATSV